MAYTIKGLAKANDCELWIATDWQQSGSIGTLVTTMSTDVNTSGEISSCCARQTVRK